MGQATVKCYASSLMDKRGPSGVLREVGKLVHQVQSGIAPVPEFIVPKTAMY